MNPKTLVETKEGLVITAVRYATVCVFAGRAWQFFFWQTPYSALLTFSKLPWEQVWENLGIAFVYIQGLVFVFCAVLALSSLVVIRQLKVLLFTGIFFLLVLSVLLTAEKNWQFNQFFEYAAQVGTPLLLLMYAGVFPVSASQKLLFGKVLVALTFSAHGLYALGFPYEQPANFLGMVQQILQVDLAQARVFLRIAGALDLLLSVGLFFTATQRLALGYAIFWGTATAVARLMAPTDWHEPWLLLHRYVFETVMRLPHALLPIAMYWLASTVQPDRPFVKN
jgi:hypothetical protein